MRERRERHNCVDRLRTMFDSGQRVVGVGEGEPLSPVVVDDVDEEPETKTEGESRTEREGSEE
mgnify:FL=1